MNDEIAMDREGASGDAARPPGPSRWRRNVVLAFFGAAGAYFLWTEHYAHTVEALPWILLLACPLMHVFMHRTHGMHRRSGEHEGHER